MRRLTVAFAAGCMVTLAFGVVGASLASAASMPAEGVFENCPLDTAMSTCVARLAVMSKGGVNVVVIPAGSGSLSSLATYAAAAHWLGMSVMWETSNPGWWQEPGSSTDMSGSFGAFSAACGCDQNSQVLAYMIHWLGSLPATYGYYAADDSMLAPGDGPGVASYVAQIKQQDPVHTVLIGSSGESMTNTYERSADMVGAEIYPVANYSLLPVKANQGIWDQVAQTAGDTQRAANQNSKQSAFILQAFSWGDNLDDGQAIGACTPNDTTASCYQKLLYPSGAEQLQLRNEVLTHAHPKLILWWSFQGTYGQAGNDTYSIYPTGTTAATRWAGLSTAIQAPPPASKTKASKTELTRKHLRVTRNAVTAAGSGGSITLRPKPSNRTARTTGATVSYTDARPAQTTLTVLRAVRGIESGNGCVASPRGQSTSVHTARCIRFAVVGSFDHRDHAGANSFHFTGRVNGYKLEVGSYRLVAFATLALRRGTSATTTFRVVS